MPDKKNEYLPLSFSSLKAFKVSPLAFIHYKLHRSEPTQAMQFGTRLHMAILEPERFANEVVVYDGRRDKRTAEYREFLEAHPNADVVTPSEMERIESARGRLQYHKSAVALLDRCTEFERKIEFSRRGIPHRGIVDAHGGNFALDIKTAMNWDADGFERTAYTASYFVQAAMYVHGLKQNNVVVDEFYFLVIQSGEPFNIALFQVDPAYLQRGLRVWDEMLNRWNQWDGSTEHVDNGRVYELRAPRWATPIVDEWSEWLAD